MPNTPLDYAPGQPIRRRRRIRRIISLIVVLAAAYPTYRWGRPAAKAAKMMYLQHRCLAYSAQGDRVVYEQECPTMAELGNRPSYHLLPAARVNPQTLAGTSSPAVGWTPEQLAGFAGYFPAGSFGGATLFMHERIPKSGARRLVIVQRPVAGSIDYPFYFVFGIHVQLIAPGTWSAPPALLSCKRMFQPIDWMSPLTAPPTKGLRFYAGQIDPHDDAHFTIRYELEGKPGVIDGRLADAGDDVELKVLNGPALGTLWVTQVLP